MFKTAFISGHTDLSDVEFNQHYAPLLISAISSGAFFVLGNASGGDTLALNYLLAKSVDKTRITIYAFNRFQKTFDHYTDLGLKVITGFTSYTSRDKIMTQNSDYDIAWVRPLEESKKLYGDKFRESRISGTQLNLERRLKSSPKDSSAPTSITEG